MSTNECVSDVCVSAAPGRHHAERLWEMTHGPECVELYESRIVRLSDEAVAALRNQGAVLIEFDESKRFATFRNSEDLSDSNPRHAAIVLAAARNMGCDDHVDPALRGGARTVFGYLCSLWASDMLGEMSEDEIERMVLDEVNAAAKRTSESRG